MKNQGYLIRAVLFDFDGTLTRPGALDFGQIRKALECPQGMPILEYIQSLHRKADRDNAFARLDDFELAGAKISVPNEGARELLDWLKKTGIAIGIITRNSRASVIRALENFDQMDAGDFDIIVTRDDPPVPKPSGEGVLWAAGRLGLPVSQILVVGDFVFDAQAGQAAGALTALLDPGNDVRLEKVFCDFRVRQLSALVTIVRLGQPLASGKLPNDLLQNYLKGLNIADPGLLMPPGVGEDVAAVDMTYNDVMILKSDPITYATNALGEFAVIVNANDIATVGAVPRWFLTTLLMPPGVTASYLESIMHDLVRICDRWGISICGGHTEITDAVKQPVVVGMMVGTVRRKALIQKKNMKTGDSVILTKAVAVEGTAIIARQFAARLTSKGISPEEIEKCCGLTDQMSIIPEARIAADSNFATAMHDVTEGGLATAMEELSRAGGHRIVVNYDKIPILDETRRICEILSLEPLGLIGSGSLLICGPQDKADWMIRQLSSQGIAAAVIGEVLGPGEGIAAFDHGRSVRWPQFDADEITKLYG